MPDRLPPHKQADARWHDWTRVPPERRRAWVRVVAMGIQTLVDPTTVEPWWPQHPVFWQETAKVRPAS